MQKNFSEMYDESGILSKEQFLESETTQKFIEWLMPLVNDDNKLNTIYTSEQHTFRNFIECKDSYKWQKDKDFETTLNRFKDWRSQLVNSDESRFKDICFEILKWGGVFHGNSKKIEEIEKRMSLKEFFNEKNELINGNNIELAKFDVNYISSGFTKLYTAMNENFIMYDGRVGSAMCCLISVYLEEKNEKGIPRELEFGYGEGRSKNNRDPNSLNNNLHFKEISSNRTIHFVSNIKANWLLNYISERINIAGITNNNDKAFALQTALFVLGNKCPE